MEYQSLQQRCARRFARWSCWRFTNLWKKLILGLSSKDLKEEMLPSQCWPRLDENDRRHRDAPKTALPAPLSTPAWFRMACSRGRVGNTWHDRVSWPAARHGSGLWRWATVAGGAGRPWQATRYDATLRRGAALCCAAGRPRGTALRQLRPES